MTKKSYINFLKIRDSFKDYCSKILLENPGLIEFQKKLVLSRGSAFYKVENPVLYNSALDKITEESEIKLILIADNPGKKEQSNEKKSYLVGPSGKIAENFFAKEKSLKIDFRKNVIIINKCPVHTPRTAELKILEQLGGEKIRSLIEDSQKRMALLACEFYSALSVPIWITGYSEMRRHGIFETWTKEVCTFLQKELIKNDDVFLFRHFSMNQFTIELNKEKKPGEDTSTVLRRIGKRFFEEIISRFQN